MAKYPKGVNLEPGMDFEQWDKDRRGFQLDTIDHAMGKGVPALFGGGGGVEVGENYPGGLGEDRHEPSYVSSNPIFGIPSPPGMGKGTSSGKISASAPQVYTKGK